MRSSPALLVLALAAAAVPGAGLAQASKHKLKPGGTGQVCLDCHGDFAEVLKRPSVHTPVRSRQCTGCHTPHASNNAKLLSAPANQACAECHGDVAPAKAMSVHAPVVEGKCTACHDPHGSANKFNLVKPVKELCATCHKGVVEGAAKAKVKHRPLEQGGCVACHVPHGSAGASHILKKAVPDLCLDCHKPNRPIFAKQHQNYPVAKGDCTSCHDPHGSGRKGMLYDEVHAPVAKGMCNQCHEAAGSPAGFRPKDSGSALCRGCHNQKVLEIQSRNRIHAPVVEGAACLNCHSPHASKAKGMLRSDLVSVCSTCHAESVKRGERSATPHPPVAGGECTSCHDPHSGDRPLLFTQASPINMCGACHDWLQHSSHPMGDKARDPRNPNLTVDCLSCHRGHGTENKKLLLNATQGELCVKCHTKYKR